MASQDQDTHFLIPGRFSGLGDDIRAAYILIVDDMAIMRKMISMTLERAGFENLSEAADGDIALAMIAERKPDIVILDINMPKVSGYEVCKVLRDNPETQDLPILVQSAAETPEERTEVFTLGATDFVSKPINKPELLARVCMHLENRLLIRSLEDYASRVRFELELACEMQQDLLPSAALVTDLGLGGKLLIGSAYQASSELGGDLWGGWPIDEYRIGIYVIDVAGHGVSAALNTFRIDAAMAQLTELKADPQAFLNALNKDLCQVMQTGQFATMLYAVLDCRTGDLKYAAAGAPAPLISDGIQTRSLDSSGLPVGISDMAGYEGRHDILAPGETLLLYSDVMIETVGQSGDMLGTNTLVRWLAAEVSEAPIQSPVINLKKRLEAESADALNDDLTLVSISRTVSGERA